MVLGGRAVDLSSVSVYAFRVSWRSSEREIRGNSAVCSVGVGLRPTSLRSDQNGMNVYDAGEETAGARTMIFVCFER